MGRKQKPPKPRLSEAVASIAYERSNGLCACGCGRRATEWHHIFGQRKYPELVDVADNIVALAEHCHREHTVAFNRLPRSICATAERLAVTPSMENYLDRYYKAEELT